MDFYRLSVWLIRSLESDLKLKMKQILWWMFMKMQWNLNGYADILLFRNFNSMHKVVMDYVCLFVCLFYFQSLTISHKIQILWSSEYTDIQHTYCLWSNEINRWVFFSLLPLRHYRMKKKLQTNWDLQFESEEIN